MGHKFVMGLALNLPALSIPLCDFILGAQGEASRLRGGKGCNILFIIRGLWSVFPLRLRDPKLAQHFEKLAQQGL